MGGAKVVYVVGFGRSGSTLLGNLLGSIDGFFSVGELHMIWRALIRDTGCGCGERVSRCDVWSTVVEDVSSHPAWPGSADAASLLARAEASVVRTRSIRAAAADDRRLSSGLRRYADLLGALYEAIGRVTGARVVVDSSKTPADAATLRLLPGIDQYLVHLVRDPRAVAYSQGRRQPTLDAHRSGEMHRRGIAESSARWVVVNRLADDLRRDVGPDRSTLLRYEDMIDRPVPVVRRIVRLTGEAGDSIPFADERTAILRPSHTVWGNRSRFAHGRVHLRPDEEWKQQRPVARAAVTLMTLPWLHAYGYRITSRQPDPEPERRKDSSRS